MQPDDLPDLASLRTLIRIADEGGIAAAARMVGLTPSAVGKTLSRMEARIGARLFQRSTRSLRLTGQGAAVLFRARRIVAEADAMREELEDPAAAPSGRLKLSLPLVGEPFLGLLAAFSTAHPQVQLDIEFSDRQVDLIGEGFDAAIRSGSIRDGRLMMTTLGSFRMELAASPGYLAAHGPVGTIDDLHGHRCIGFRFAHDGRLGRWPLVDGPSDGQPYAVISNNLEARVAFTLQNVGIGLLPSFAIAGHVREGRLIRLLGGVAETVPLALLWPSSQHQPLKVRAFADFMVAGLRPLLD